MTRHLWSVQSFDDLLVGDEWESPRRTVTETDVVGFAGLSGDFNPLHVDHSSQVGNPFGRPVAHGLLGLAIATGLASQAPRVGHPGVPGHRGMEISPSHLVWGHDLRRLDDPGAEPTAGGRRGVVTWHRRILNQDGHLVQEGRTQTLVRGRTATSTSKPPQTDGSR